ncbi:ribosomal protein L15 [Coccomyxa subellipsoidea C-169]|uniref:Ribosomal protein L15 n=1 Tax=Coccomyxa subellipsoidea (strain C-169) TaxID=574566 RepID=I0YYR6_COCSC|nr:ribosomal protein L15 [Coccomyxa subellipsoidea C-169]EIE23535.1 ribosomal protein L15 [Coccomyxa subellipsoidea C-169]|eukprot:XP_005648079.1 ribosomal protein L15 [Coccomyxa subellipsoidea C-169]
MQASHASCSAFCKGGAVLVLQPRRRSPVGALVIRAASKATYEGYFSAEPAERLRLNNLSPQPGARRPNKRKGRGYGAGQGGSCGFGMRGQKSRSGSGTRPGFQGGQTPLYRQMPKLRGIAGGMSAGIPRFVTVNLRQLNEKFQEGEEVSLETLQQKNLLNLSGREASLPLKILGDGELKLSLKVHATQFSASARTKIEAAGGTIVDVAPKIKWTRALGKERKAAAEAAPKPTKTVE